MVIHAGRNYGNTTHLADGLLKALGQVENHQGRQS